MFSSTPSVSLVGLVLGLLCHTAGGPVLGSMATTLQTQADQPPQVVSQTPLRAAVRDFAESTPAAAPMPVYMAPPVMVNAFPPAADSSQAPPAIPGAALGPAPSGEDASVSDQETALVAMIDQARQSQGEDPLTIDPLLVRIAREHSEDMCVRNYFDHSAPAPGPTTPMDRYVAALSERPDYAMVGENIYYRSATESSDEDATEANEAFMHSPGHRANILTPGYTSVGVGIYVNPATGEFWVTEMFLRDSP